MRFSATVAVLLMTGSLANAQIPAPRSTPSVPFTIAPPLGQTITYPANTSITFAVPVSASINGSSITFSWGVVPPNPVPPDPNPIPPNPIPPNPIPPNPIPPKPDPDWIPPGPKPDPPAPTPLQIKTPETHQIGSWEWRNLEWSPGWKGYGRMVDGEFMISRWEKIQ